MRRAGSRPRASVSRWPRLSPLAPAAALAVIAGSDGVRAVRDWPVVVLAVLDEPAHLLTAGLALMAVAGRVRARTVAWVLCGSVAIDLDHIPLYLGWDTITPEGGRPVTHSLATVVALLLLAAVPRLRPAAPGLAAGLLLHLARDIATGPGVPLLWPLSDESTLVPYWVYFAGLSATAVVATVMSARRSAAQRPMRRATNERRKRAHGQKAQSDPAR